MANWLTDTVETSVVTALDYLGKARYILDGVTDENQIKWAQKLGIALFQGDFIAPPRQ